MNAENPLNNLPRETPMRELGTEGQNLSEEQEDRYKQWMKDHPEIVIAPEDLRECEPEIVEFEVMLTSFELIHSLAKLHVIVDLKPEDAPKHSLRESARVALIPIAAKLNILKEETNIAFEKYEELKAKYMHLSRAVGIIKNNKVDHTR